MPALRSVVAGILVAYAVGADAMDKDAFRTIRSPYDARLFGLDSLRTATVRSGGVPLPKDLQTYVKDRDAAIRLGKALFWEMQVGSDGVQACASCHFHAGTDDRTTNALSPNQAAILDQRSGNPAVGYFLSSSAAFVQAPTFELKPPNATLVREDFPFVRTIQDLNVTASGTVEPVVGNSNDIGGSMGVLFHQFDGIQLGASEDLGTELPDPLFFTEGSKNVRQVEGRNTPSVINAVFNHTNFWDGHANPVFNGLNAFGDQVRLGALFFNDPGAGLLPTTVTIDQASLASQAMAPPITPVEMSYGNSQAGNGRRFREIGLKLLRANDQTGQPVIPLAKQLVHPNDSVLGTLSRAPAPGLATTYADLIKAAFVEQWWNSSEPLFLGATPVATEFTQMEANFSLFFGLSIALYEATLVADRTPFDRWMETGRLNAEFDREALAGLNLFVKEGRCITCHSGPELTSASIRSVQGGKQSIRAMAMAQGDALYDNGFYNIGVTPTTDDAGRGNSDPLAHPLAFSRQVLWSRLGIPQLPEFEAFGLPGIGFAIIGGDTLPAVGEASRLPVCDDVDRDGTCASNEPIRPEFQRVAVDGAFKTPGLRNIALTGPYFHNGGVATLRQVVQFYNRGGNFCSFNINDLDTDIRPLGLTSRQERQLVAFLESLTDPRVAYESAPFDHPELHIPEDGLDREGRRVLPAVGRRGHGNALETFLSLDPQDAIFTPRGLCFRASL